MEGLTEKLIIGLPGLSFLGARIDFATGDVRVSRRRKKKVDGISTAERNDEMHLDQALVRGAKTGCMESKDTTKLRAVSSKRSPEGEVNKKGCTESQLPRQVEDLAKKDELRDKGHEKNVKKPNQTKKENSLSGLGRKEGDMSVVSSRREEKHTA